MNASSTARRGRRTARRSARQAKNSTAMAGAARWGFAARGVIYLLVGALAVQIAFGEGGREADRSGALQTVAKTPGGTVLLWLLAAGLGGMALWRLSEAAYGQAGADGHTATRRLSSLARGVFYAVVCSTTVAFVIGAGGPGSSDEKSKDLTGTAMHDVPFGRWLVLLTGLGFVAGGIGIAVRAVRTKFEKNLRTHQMSRPVRTAVAAVGVVGQTARATVYAAVGVFLAYAAIGYDEDKAKGVDGTLREFTKTGSGPWLLVLVASGLIVFGLFSFCEARWRRV
jgi:hypothetical protein